MQNMVGIVSNAVKKFDSILSTGVFIFLCNVITVVR